MQLSAQDKERVRIKREYLKMTRDELAEKSALSYREIYDIEEGRRSSFGRNTLIRVARALNLTIHELLQEDPRQTSPTQSVTDLGLPSPTSPESLYETVSTRETVLPPPLNEAIRWIHELIEKVAAFHSDGSPHGHLSPWTIRLSDDGSLLLADIPVGHVDQSLPQRSVIYSSPRSASESGTPTIRGDVFSLGQTCFFILTALEPQGHIGTVREHRRDCPDSLSVLIQRMRDHSPDRRPSSAIEVLRLLKKAVQDLRTAALREQWKQHFSNENSLLEKQQRLILRSLRGNPEFRSHPFVFCLHDLLDYFGPFWLGPATSDNWYTLLEQGSFRSNTVYDDSYSTTAIETVSFINLLTDIQLRVDTTGQIKPEFPGRLVDSAFSDLKQLPPYLQERMIRDFGVRETHKIIGPACSRCHHSLTKVFNVSPPPYLRIAICTVPSCVEQDVPRCTDCGYALGPIKGSDTWGTFNAIGCKRCGTTHALDDAGKTPTNNWNGELELRRIPPEVEFLPPEQ